ncbi:MAG TPA: Ig-like domain-containing protein [Bryobacteraceae bacterium]|nr:Ig-like domain-containing protein [Bryobacteraceae bacterium]
MKTGSLCDFQAPIRLFVLAGLVTSAVYADTTFTFQNGVNSYTGAKDVSINTQYSQYNGGNGVLWRGDSELGCYTTTGTGSYAVRYLLKFGGISIPAGSKVTAATLAISLDTWTAAAAGNITGFYLLNPWNPDANNIGWLHRDDANNNWAGPGASSVGVDTVAGKSFPIPALRAAGPQTLTVPLDLAQVQSWIDSPATNQGIMLVNNIPGLIVNPVSTVGTLSMRPKLSITVSSGVTPVQVTISPTTATLQTGATQQFTATVTGSTNTAVTWSATGGTISSTGLYTAGTTAGTSFTVTATSIADTTKTATAHVTVQTAPAVSVTVSPTTATLQSGATQQFTATVTGSTNTAVTWSATGGTISSTGLYTAGTTAGTSFTVTATSSADTTKTATAHVTIQSPPAISVTISPTTATLQSGATQQFTATVTGITNTAVTWSATGGTISSAGLYTAGQTAGSFSVVATAAADTTKTATASVSITTATTGLPPVPRMVDGPYVVVQSPVSGMHFTAPAMVRIYADPYDGNAPDPDALTVKFLVNGQSIGTFTGSGAQNGYFPFTANNLASGTYTITAQITATGGGVVTSAPVTIFVDNPPATSGPVFNLSADVVLSGSQSTSYAGTAGNPCLINGNGFQIRAASGFTGSLSISNCLIRGLGNASKSALDVTVNGSGSIQLTGNVFDTFGKVSIGANDQAQATVRGNEFRENTLVPVGSQPEDASTLSAPVFYATGNSSAQQLFQANNVGLSNVVFENTRNWLIGGSTDADSNVLMGVRCGFRISGSTNMVLRGNYSQHNYPHRFSQGENFQLDGDGFLVEHNVIRSSSWPVRGVGGEVRYNLIDASGNSDQVFQAPLSNANIHHNIFSFTVSQTFYSPGAGLRLMYNVDNVQFHNNVMDGGGAFMNFNGSPIAVLAGSFLSSLRNNVFYNFEISDGEPVLAGDLGESTTPPLARLRYADYNDFYNPIAPNQINYGLGVVGISPGAAGYAMHDLGGLNGHVNPKFTQPSVTPFPFRPDDIWSRNKKVSDVLSMYRAMYTPASGSPLLGAGDPQDGAGGNIGAIGNGEAADQFGMFGKGTVPPVVPVISKFTSSPASIAPGQSTTLSWTVTGATALSISPAPGTVTGTSVSVTPAATTTYILTATNSAGPATATTTVTVTSSPSVSVTVSPTTTTLAPGATQQFTATVTGASNSAVTWTATGGTITSAGLFTAGQGAGSFHVTATSVQDTTKSATATVTITAPTVSVMISPSPVSLFTGGTQQFTATVTGASNTAVTWSATGGTITTAGLYTAGQTTGAFQVNVTSVQDPTKSASAVVNIVTQSTSARPRIILDAPTLATLRSRAAGNTAQWTALKQVCDSMVGGTVNFPGDNGYPDLPSIGEGYQGDGYLASVMPLGLCYQVLKTSDPTNAAKYGAKGVAILTAMSDPAHQVISGTPIQDRDDGYGIRFYGVTMGMGYDWFHDLLTPALQTQLQNALTTWIQGFENDSPDAFEYEHPMGNYFAGYYAAKCMAALALQGDNAIGDTWWNDWYNRVHNQFLAPYYAVNLAGGGWPEGFANYGPLATRNQALPALAVRSAKGIDLIHAAQPYPFPLDQARWVMSFTWPSRDMVDDRDTVHSNGSDTIWPGTPDANTYSFLAGYLAMWNDPLAPMMHKYARDAKAALIREGDGAPDEWIEFLFWDDTAPEADYSTFRQSYLASGTGEVAARSDWTNAATWMSFRSGPYVNNPGAGHQGFDAGSLALVRDKSPLLVNVEGWLAHEPNGDAGENAIYDDNFGNWDADHTVGNRRLYNTFQVRHLDASGNVLDHFGQWPTQRSDGSRTQVSRYEDGGSYVMALGQYLEDMYRPFTTICNASPVTSWSRQVIYLRPSQFVVYDRTNICNSTLDQYMAFHFPALPTEVAAPAAGLHRFDVNAGAFAGSMTTILPANAAFVTTDHLDPDSSTWGKVWRTEIRPSGAAQSSGLWMTAFDMSASSSQVAAATPLTVTGGAVVGAVLASSSGNSVTVFGTAPAGTAISGTVSYTAPAAQTRHVITDLTPQGAYTVSVTVSGGNHLVTVTPGGNLHASANGVLTFAVTPAGALQP